MIKSLMDLWVCFSWVHTVRISFESIQCLLMILRRSIEITGICVSIYEYDAICECFRHLIFDSLRWFLRTHFTNIRYFHRIRKIIHNIILSWWISLEILTLIIQPIECELIFKQFTHLPHQIPVLHKRKKHLKRISLGICCGSMSLFECGYFFFRILMR